MRRIVGVGDRARPGLAHRNRARAVRRERGGVARLRRLGHAVGPDRGQQPVRRCARPGVATRRHDGPANGPRKVGRRQRAAAVVDDRFVDDEVRRHGGAISRDSNRTCICRDGSAKCQGPSRHVGVQSNRDTGCIKNISHEGAGRAKCRGADRSPKHVVGAGGT